MKVIKSYYLISLIMFALSYKAFAIPGLVDLILIAADEAAKAGPAAAHMVSKGSQVGADVIKMINEAKAGLKEVETVSGFSTSGTLASVSYGRLLDEASSYYDYNKDRLNLMRWGTEINDLCYYGLDTGVILERPNNYPDNTLTCPDGDTKCLESVQLAKKYRAFFESTPRTIADDLQNKLIDGYINTNDQEIYYARQTYPALLSLHTFLMDYRNLESALDAFFQVILGSAEQLRGMYLDFQEHYNLKMHYCLSAHDYVTWSKKF